VYEALSLCTFHEGRVHDIAKQTLDLEVDCRRFHQRERQFLEIRRLERAQLRVRSCAGGKEKEKEKKKADIL
jgi:hypothetical protein